MKFYCETCEKIAHYILGTIYCPECGGELQPTTKTIFSFDGEEYEMNLLEANAPK